MKKKKNQVFSPTQKKKKIMSATKLKIETPKKIKDPFEKLNKAKTIEDLICYDQIGERSASKILEIRKTLPNEKFTSLKELESIPYLSNERLKSLVGEEYHQENATFDNFTQFDENLDLIEDYVDLLCDLLELIPKQTNLKLVFSMFCLFKGIYSILNGSTLLELTSFITIKALTSESMKSILNFVKETRNSLKAMETYEVAGSSFSKAVISYDKVLNHLVKISEKATMDQRLSEETKIRLSGTIVRITMKIEKLFKGLYPEYQILLNDIENKELNSSKVKEILAMKDLSVKIKEKNVVVSSRNNTSVVAVVVVTLVLLLFAVLVEYYKQTLLKRLCENI